MAIQNFEVLNLAANEYYKIPPHYQTAESIFLWLDLNLFKAARASHKSKVNTKSLFFKPLVSMHIMTNN